MSLNINSNNITFTGRKNILSKEDKMLEHQRGMMAGLEAKKRGVSECSEIILRETLALNFDFLNGFNKIIGKDMAKKAYKIIGK